MDSSSFHSLVHILITLGFWMIKGWAVPILKIFWFLQWLPVNQEDLKSITFWFRSNLYQTVLEGNNSWVNDFHMNFLLLIVSSSFLLYLCLIKYFSFSCFGFLILDVSSTSLQESIRHFSLSLLSSVPSINCIHLWIIVFLLIIYSSFNMFKL